MEEPDIFAIYTSAFLQAAQPQLKALTSALGERAEIGRRRPALDLRLLGR